MSNLRGVLIIALLLLILIAVELEKRQPARDVDIVPADTAGYLAEIRSHNLTISPNTESQWIATGRAVCFDLPGAAGALVDSGWREDQVYDIVTSAQHHLCRITPR